MPLRRKLLLINVALVVGLSLIGLSALWGLAGIGRMLEETVAECEELRIVQHATLSASAAGLLMATEGAAPSLALERLASAREALREFAAFQDDEQDRRDEHDVSERRLAGAALEQVGTTIAALEAGDRPEALRRSERLRATLAEIEGLTDVSGVTAATTARMSSTLLLAAGAAALMVAGAAVASVLVHRAVMEPLRRLQSGVRTLASGRFDQRVPIEADPEFAVLARDFNAMASELGGVYANLESQVATKGRELARSERLASVGFLAAGVAHEINNPLGIMSGYAELCRRWLGPEGESPASGALDDARRAVTVIAEEAQRCKGITSKLLSMSRMGDGAREPVALSTIAGDVVGMLHAILSTSSRPSSAITAAAPPRRGSWASACAPCTTGSRSMAPSGRGGGGSRPCGDVAEHRSVLRSGAAATIHPFIRMNG